MKTLSKQDWIYLAVFFIISACLMVYIGRYTKQKTMASQISEDSIIQSEEVIETKQQVRQDDSSTKWKKFAGTTYKATQFLSNNVIQNYAFGYNSSGTGTYIIFETMPGTNVVTDQLEFSIYKVTSDADCIYLHCSEINSPVRIRIKGYSLYTNDGSERYEEWQ